MKFILHIFHLCINLLQPFLHFHRRHHICPTFTYIMRLITRVIREPTNPYNHLSVARFLAYQIIVSVMILRVYLYFLQPRHNRFETSPHTHWKSFRFCRELSTSLPYPHSTRATMRMTTFFPEAPGFRVPSHGALYKPNKHPQSQIHAHNHALVVALYPKEPNILP